MGVLDAAMQAEAMGQQKSAGLVNSLVGGMEAITNIGAERTQLAKDAKFKEAGQKLAELGGLSKENLKQVVMEYGLSPEETKEFITTWGAFHKTMWEMQEKSRDVYSDTGKSQTIGESDPVPEGFLTGKGQDIRTKNERLALDTAEKKKAKITYKTLGSNIYKIEGGKSSMIQKGSDEEKAVTRAMRDDSWRYATEPERLELIEQQKRFITGKPKAETGEIDAETKNALDAIKRGVPKESVKKMYKERTGKELPGN